MATMSDVVRKITIQSTQTGANETAAALDKMAVAQGNVAITAERSSKSMLSMESSLHKLKLSLDEEYRSEEKLAQIEKTLHAARLQGAVSIEEQNRLLGLAKLKYTEAGEAAKVMGERMETAKELAKGLLTGLGAGLVLTGLAEVPAKIKETVEEVAKIGEAAQTIGISAQALQELDYAAKATGSSTETMNSALEKFSKNLGVAATGSGALYKILKENGLKVTGDLNKDLANYANLIQGATNAEQKNNLTTAAFGKNAQELGRAFNGGAEGLKRFAEEADGVGIHTDEAVNSAREMHDQFVKLQAQLDVSFQGFMLTVAPPLLVVLNGITVAVQAVNAAVQAAEWVLQKQLPLAYQSTQHIEEDLKQNLALVSASKGGPPKITADASGKFINTNPMRVRIPDLQANKAADLAQADEAELTQRRAAAVSGYIDTHGNGGWGTLPKPTITHDTSGDAAAAAAAKKLQSVTDALNLQLKTLTETDRQKQIDTELSKAGVEASTKQGKAIEALTGKLYDEKKALADANQAANFLAQSTETAFEGIITGSSSVQDALAGIVKALAQAVIQAELLGSGPLAGILGTSPTTSGGAGGILGSLFSALIPHANGGVYNSPSLSAYSNQVVTKPTLFAFANGGVMGEAGPEAIMPLRRGPDGKLGVSAANSNAAAPSIVYAPVYNFQSASIEELARIKAQAAADRESFAVRVQKAMGDKRTR
jgi:hypothetical protein